MAPCSLLADFLGVRSAPGQPAFISNPRGVAHPRVGPLQNVMGSAYFPVTVPEGAEVIGVDEFSGQVFGWNQRLPGGGQVIVLGLQRNHAMREPERMLSYLLAELGARQVITCDNPNLWVTAVADGKQGVLFVLNLFTAPFSARIQVRNGDQTAFDEQVTVDPISVRIFPY